VAAAKYEGCYRAASTAESTHPSNGHTSARLVEWLLARAVQLRKETQGWWMGTLRLISR